MISGNVLIIGKKQFVFKLAHGLNIDKIYTQYILCIYEYGCNKY